MEQGKGIVIKGGDTGKIGGWDVEGMNEVEYEPKYEIIQVLYHFRFLNNVCGQKTQDYETRARLR